jgi:hypothetical protein
VDFGQRLEVLRSQVAEGVIDDDDPKDPNFRMSEEELTDLGQGVLHTRGQWKVTLEPYPSMAQGTLHTVLTGMYLSPYVPGFYASVTINDADAGDPDKFLCVGVLGPEASETRLAASLDDAKQVLTLTATDDSDYTVVETFSSSDDEGLKVVEFFRRGRIVDPEGRVSALVHDGKLKPSLLTAPIRLIEKFNLANKVLLQELAREKVASLGDELKQLEDPDLVIDGHHERLKLQSALDWVKASGSIPPRDSLPPPGDDIGEIAETLLANRATNPPKSGGARSLWLSKVGMLNNDLYNKSLFSSKQHQLVDEGQREFYSLQLLQMMQADHQHHRNVRKWRELTRKIDALTKLIESPIEHRVLLEAADKATHELPLAKLQEQAEAETPVALAPPEAPSKKDESDSDSDEEEFHDDYEKLEAQLRAHPSAVPLLLRGGREDDEPAELVDAVDPKAVLAQKLEVKNQLTETKARLSQLRHPRKEKVKTK